MLVIVGLYKKLINLLRWLFFILIKKLVPFCKYLMVFVVFTERSREIIQYKLISASKRTLGHLSTAHRDVNENEIDISDWDQYDVTVVSWTHAYIVKVIATSVSSFYSRWRPESRYLRWINSLTKVVYLPTYPPIIILLKIKKISEFSAFVR